MTAASPISSGKSHSELTREEGSNPQMMTSPTMGWQRPGLYWSAILVAIRFGAMSPISSPCQRFTYMMATLPKRTGSMWPPTAHWRQASPVLVTTSVWPFARMIRARGKDDEGVVVIQGLYAPHRVCGRGQTKQLGRKARNLFGGNLRNGG